jgi:hypothetical protein
MVTRGRGTKGACRSYIKEIAKLLAKLGIDDPVVAEFSLQRPES